MEFRPVIMRQNKSEEDYPYLRIEWNQIKSGKL